MIKIPPILQWGSRHGILVSDEEVAILSWRGNVLSKIAVFANDDDGAHRAEALLDGNPRKFSGQPFHILVNIIGEDYRYEKTSHLLGKLRADFHSRRIKHLFRGGSLAMSEVQGRDDGGKREDLVLFSGVLTEQKVAPWISLASRGGRMLAGVHLASHMLARGIFTHAGGKGRGCDLLITLHERGALRQTFFVNGRLRFSRVSKIDDDSSGEKIGDVLKQELERTTQYVRSLRISLARGLTVRVILPKDLLKALRERFSDGERITFKFFDAAKVGRSAGLKKPPESIGHDSSLPLHAMFSGLHLQQLASPQAMLPYWMRASARAALAAMLCYGIYAYSIPIGHYIEGYQSAGVSEGLSQQANELSRQYNAEVSGSFEEPPSSPRSMQAVSDLFSVLERIEVSPAQLLYYVGHAFRANPGAQINNISWRVANSADGNETTPIASGEDLYHIADVEGEFLEQNPGETYVDVAARGDRLMASFAEHSDISVEALSLPPSEIDRSTLSGSLADGSNVDAPVTRAFKLRVTWKAYSKERLSELTGT